MIFLHWGEERFRVGHHSAMKDWVDRHRLDEIANRIYCILNF